MNRSELTFENIGNGPIAVKILVMALVCTGILVAGYGLDIRRQRIRLKAAQKQEIALRTSFEIQHAKAANVAVYQQQIEDLKGLLTDRVQRLPADLTRPVLIETLSNLGASSGLTLTLIKPEPEIHQEFYTELPIGIVAEGYYDQLASFIEGLARLKQIVILERFTVRQQGSGRDGPLIMDMVVKTYRYRAEMGSE